MEKPATDPYNLRTRAQTRSQKPDRRRDTADVEEGVATTVGEIARQTDYTRQTYPPDTSLTTALHLWHQL